MKSKHDKDLAKMAKREKLFSTLAKKEGRGAAERAQRERKLGYKESAHDSRNEAVIDRDFATARAAIANRAKAKIKGK